MWTATARMTEVRSNPATCLSRMRARPRPAVPKNAAGLIPGSPRPMEHTPPGEAQPRRDAQAPVMPAAEICDLPLTLSSPPRRRGPKQFSAGSWMVAWVPAYAGMTAVRMRQPKFMSADIMPTRETDCSVVRWRAGENVHFQTLAYAKPAMF